MLLSQAGSAVVLSPASGDTAAAWLCFESEVGLKTPELCYSPNYPITLPLLLNLKTWYDVFSYLRLDKPKIRETGSEGSEGMCCDIDGLTG